MRRGNSRPPARVPWRRPQAIPHRAPDLGLPAGASASWPPSFGTSRCQTRGRCGLFSLRDADAEGRRATEPGQSALTTSPAVSSC